MTVARLIVAVILLTYLVGCFRYTPSRREMTNSGTEASKVAGPEAFQSYHKDLQSRLDTLLKERATMATMEGQNSSYQIGVKDVLRVDVFGFSDLSGDTQVADDGNISLPLLGAVKAAGMTQGELQNDLTVRFKRYIRQPIVRLSVNSFNAYRASVVGAVVKPGLVALKRPGFPLTELLSEVGGVRDNAGSRLYLIPARDGAAPSQDQRAGVEIEFDQLVGTLDKAPIVVPIMPGDTIIVPESGQFRIEGEVERPGTFPVSKKLSTLGALAAAGGPTYAANVKEVEVIRDVGSGKKASMTVDIEKVAFHGEPDISLRDGDVVVVPSMPGRFRAQQVVEGIRTILRGGVSGSIRYQQ